MNINRERRERRETTILIMKNRADAITPQKIDAAIEQINSTWFVRDPLKRRNIWKYMVVGVDQKGDFQVARRYNDFIALRMAFV
jgi:hypothetical protein